MLALLNIFSQKLRFAGQNPCIRPPSFLNRAFSEVEMFAKYATIDDVMAGEGRQLVMKELNATPLYVDAVKALRYKRIGIAVLDNNGKETSKYASLNGEAGNIDKIIEGFGDEKPDIAVTVKGSVLMEILHNVEWVKDNPLAAFVRYAPRFQPYDRSYILPLLVKLPQLARRLFAHH